MSDLDAAFSAVLGDVFRREADHWEAEYNALVCEHPHARKAQAAWKLGAGILRRRAEQYASGTVRYLHLVPALADTDRDAEYDARLGDGDPDDALADTDEGNGR